MGMKVLNAEEVEERRKQYPPGTRIKLIRMDDPQAPDMDTEGVVTGVDSVGTVQIRWDNGSHLGIIPELDEYEILEGVIDEQHTAVSE